MDESLQLGMFKAALAALDGITSGSPIRRLASGDDILRGWTDDLQKFYGDIEGKNGPQAAIDAASRFALPMTIVGPTTARMAGGSLKRSLERTHKMEEFGADAEQIMQETGWWRGGDDTWRKEIDDTRFKIHPRKGKISHPELPKAMQDYPNLKMTADYGPPGNGLYDDGTIYVSPQNPTRDRVAALHELQHYLQDVEERGADYIGTNSNIKGGYPKYLRNPGEMESRVVEQRADWTPEMRSNFPFTRHMALEKARLKYQPLQYFPDKQITDYVENLARGIPER